MAKKATYPDWVLKYKTKGVYVNKIGDNYYLYKAHSERVKGTDKIKRICDGYIGKVTEKDGLIQPKDEVKTDVIAYEYGNFYILYLLTQNIYDGFKITNAYYADSIMSLSMLKILNIDNEYFDNTPLKLLYPKANKKHLENNEIINEIDRCISMINYYINNKYNGDFDKDISILKYVYLVNFNKKYYISKVNNEINKIFKRNGMELKYGKN